MPKPAIVVTILALIFVAAVLFALFRLSEVNKREVVNRYYGSEYSFTYPLGYELQEDDRDVLSVGSTTQTGFTSVVDLTTLSMPTEGADFDTFVRERITDICATQTPTERTSCTVGETEERLETAAGERARVYTLTLTRDVQGEEPQTLSFGPLYVYILGPIEVNGTTTFAALVVHHSLSSVLTGNQDTALLTRINDSVRIGDKRD